MLVFRENRVVVSTHPLVRTLAEKIRCTDGEPLLDALLRAGELECALTDAGSSAAAQVGKVTDALAQSVVTGRACGPLVSADSLGSLELPAKVRISPPEGFAYYALHPLSYAQLALESAGTSARVAVIGIRSIGTTLGAIVAAALTARGVPAQRISIRPTGHPFDRTTHFNLEELCWVERERDRGAYFLVVDEGPGLSGSSFLSVGEALLRAGVSRSKLTFLCSHKPNPESLRARNSAARWSNFQVRAVGENSRVRNVFTTNDTKLPKTEADVIELSGGKWRELRYPDPQQWPASWVHMERVKFVSAGQKLLFKFEGFGRFGTEVFDRARVIADAGFGPAPREVRDGFATYSWIDAAPGDPSHLSEPLLNRLGDYCAFRARAFRTRSCSNETNLAEMVRCNLREEIGFEPELDDAALQPEVPVIVDGRMQPHEWLCSDRGRWLKVDGSSHGDDHFYPGPTDSAWDLAGAIIEWRLDQQSKEYFLARYRRLSGDDPGSRLPSFLLAYSAFRLGYCKMAAESVPDVQERERLTRDYHRYRSFLHAQLAGPHRGSTQSAAAERRENVAHGVSRG